MARLEVRLSVTVPDRPGMSPTLLVAKTIGFDSGDAVINDLQITEVPEGPSIGEMIGLT